MEKNESNHDICRRKQTFCSNSDETKFKVILVGDSSVRKTSLFLDFTDDGPEKTTKSSLTTVDFRLQPLEIEGQISKLYIWDTAG
jgi:GTPase SAR1 family protein